MTVNLYSIFDSKAKSFGPVFLFPNDDVAIRYAHQAVKTIPEVANFASDYVLYRLGILDQANGRIDQANLSELVVLDSFSSLK